MAADSSYGKTDVASLVIVIGTAAIIGISLGMFPPLISLRAEAAGISSVWTGALAGAPPLAMLMFGLSFPGLIGRWGMLRCFYASTAIAVAGALLFPLVDIYWLWLVLRFIMGAALGLQWVVSESWISGLARGPRRGTIMGVYIAVFSAGLAGGPLILSFTGSEGVKPFGVAAAILVPCGLLLPLAKQASGIESKDPPKPVVTTLRIAMAENLAGFVHGARYGTSLALLPLYAIHLNSEPSRSLNLLSVMCVGSLIFQPISGRLIDRFSPQSVLLVSAIAQVAFAVVLAPALQSAMMMWPLMLAWGATGGAMYTAGITGIGTKFSNHDLPAATTGFTMVWEAGALSGPLLAGIAMQVWDPHGMAAVIGVLGAVLVLALLRFSSTAAAR